MRKENKKFQKEAFFKFLRKNKVYDDFFDNYNDGDRFRGSFGYSKSSVDAYFQKTDASQWICNAFGWGHSGRPGLWSRLSDMWETFLWYYNENLVRTPYFNRLAKYKKKIFFHCFSFEQNKNTRVI